MAQWNRQNHGCALGHLLLCNSILVDGELTAVGKRSYENFGPSHGEQAAVLSWEDDAHQRGQGPKASCVVRRRGFDTMWGLCGIHALSKQASMSPFISARSSGVWP